MNRAIVILSLFVVSSQSEPCTDAQLALGLNAACGAAFADGRNITAICTGICRDLFDNIISNCDGSVSIAKLFYPTEGIATSEAILQQGNLLI